MSKDEINLILRRLDKTDQQIDAKFDAIDTKFDAIDTKLDVMKGEISNLRADVHTRIDGVLRFLEAAGIVPDNWGE
ncbi:MAG: hypothetical protein OXG09_06200 [Chloroflexi bacterium]|nr:hypothetical protein [Chloroflexota bacterium]